MDAYVNSYARCRMWSGRSSVDGNAAERGR
jgi:hypothetical protein